MAKTNTKKTQSTTIATRQRLERPARNGEMTYCYLYGHGVTLEASLKDLQETVEITQRPYKKGNLRPWDVVGHPCEYDAVNEKVIREIIPEDNKK